MVEDEEARSFTSWKMDWINALMIGVDHREFRVSVCMLQHANRKTKLIKPAQHRIAILLGCSVSAVERAISVLVKSGWLEITRRNRQSSNHYQFVEAKRTAMVDLRQSREDAWGDIISLRRKAPDPAEVKGQDQPDPAEVKGPEPSEMTGRDPAEVTGEHLKGTPEGNTLILGVENTDLSVGQYARGNQDTTQDAYSGHGEGVAQRAPQERRSKQPLPHSAYSSFDEHLPESAALVGTNSFVPPDFDALEREIRERQAKANRRKLQYGNSP